MKKLWLVLVVMSLMTSQLPAAARALVRGAGSVVAHLPVMRGGVQRATACSIAPYSAKDVASAAGSSSSGGEHPLFVVGGVVSWIACALFAAQQEVDEKQVMEAFMRAHPHMSVCVFNQPDGTRRHLRNPFYKGPEGLLN